MTSAPKSDSTVAAAGAAMKLAQSRTLRPSKMPFSMMVPLPCRLLVLLIAAGGGEQLVPARQQGCIAAGGGDIDGDRLFGGEPCQVMRPAGLGGGAGEGSATAQVVPDDGAP